MTAFIEECAVALSDIAKVAGRAVNVVRAECEQLGFTSARIGGINLR